MERLVPDGRLTGGSVLAVTRPPGRRVAAAAVTVRPGAWATWQRRNRLTSVPHAIGQLRAAGTLDNFRRVATGTGDRYRGRYPFVDTDVYKTLEAIAHTTAEHDDGETALFRDEAIDAVVAAQQPDGYLGTWCTGPEPHAAPFADLTDGHELYNLGHLIQAAVAHHDRRGDDRLLGAARRFADLVIDLFGPSGRPGYCGHPGVETALVDLFRTTGDERYLDQAELFLERRGSGRLDHRTFGAEYYIDHAPLAQLSGVAGHAVRMTYLAAGATDVAFERGDRAAIDHLHGWWRDMVATRSYVTGGVGSRHSDEAFGDRYELSPERAYAETCAAIGVWRWGWSLLGATGDTTIADHLDVVLHNAIAVGVGADGVSFSYDNPLQRRPDHGDAPPRRAWFGCACCPPNLLRTVAELGGRVAFADGDSLTLAALVPAQVRTQAIEIQVDTDYPTQGQVSVRVLRAPAHPMTLRVRIPGSAVNPRARFDGDPLVDAVRAGWLSVTREFRPGQLLEISFGLPVRTLGSHPRMDATRGAVAVVRGPVVHCLEQCDSPTPIDDLRVVSVRATADSVLARVRTVPHSEQPYPAVRLGDPEPPSTSVADRDVPLVPYAQWGNRQPGAMRVWLPH